MRKLHFTDNNGVTWERVSKQTARREFEAGEAVVLSPCKCDPFGLWALGSVIWRSEDGRSFDQYSNEFEYYNCNNELGNYAAFYIVR